MTNTEIIANEAMMVGFEYDGENLKTFNEWKNAGYLVKKGEKAFMKVDLWKPFVKKVESSDGESKTERRFMLKTSHLFHTGQVQREKK